MFFNSDNILTELKNNPLCTRRPPCGAVETKGRYANLAKNRTASTGKPPVRVVYKGVLPVLAAVGAETSGASATKRVVRGAPPRGIARLLNYRLSRAARRSSRPLTSSTIRKKIKTRASGIIRLGLFPLFCRGFSLYYT